MEIIYTIQGKLYNIFTFIAQFLKGVKNFTL